MAQPDFHGACLDTGAQRSVIGKSQAIAYFRFMGLPLVLSDSKPKVYKFGSNHKVSVGKAKFRIPYAGNRHMHVELDIINIDIPLLFGLDLLDEFKIVADNVDNRVYCKRLKRSVPIVRKFGHLYYEWPYEMIYSMTELKKMHHHFYHPQPSGCSTFSSKRRTRTKLLRHWLSLNKYPVLATSARDWRNIQGSFAFPCRTKILSSTAACLLT